MRPKTLAARLFVYLLLLCGAAVFVLPLAWLVVTSLKPIEQTMAIPPSWIPRRYEATVEGRRMEVTRNFVINEKGALVVAEAGPEKGKKILVREQELSAPSDTHAIARLPVFEGGVQHSREYPVTVVRRIEPGAWHVTEASPTKVRSHDLAWDVVPESDIEAKPAPRWDNYRKALATIGGRQLEEVEGSASGRKSGIGEDTRVSFYLFLGNTVFVCVLSVIGAVLSNAVIAYGLAKVRWKGRDAIFALTLSTMMVPFPVLMVPLYGVFRALGLIGTLYPLWLPTFFGSAFNIFLMRQFFLTLPDQLGEAARIDGCSEWGIFWRIILPLSRPVLSVVALFQFLLAWNDFLGPLLYLTRRHTFTLALALANYRSQAGGVQWQYLMAASAVMIAPVIVLFFFTQKTFIRGIATTGLKG